MVLTLLYIKSLQAYDLHRERICAPLVSAQTGFFLWNAHWQLPHFPFSLLLPTCFFFKLPYLLTAALFRFLNGSSSGTLMASSSSPTSKAPYFCDSCLYRSFDLAELIRHMRQSHLDYRAKCLTCKLWFRSRKAMSLHTARDCTGPSNKCNVCSRVFPGRTSLNIHKHRRHGQNFAHACNRCEAVFSNKSAMQQHRNEHASTGIKCPVCRVIFASFNRLAQHVEIVHGTEVDF